MAEDPNQPGLFARASNWYDNTTRSMTASTYDMRQGIGSWVARTTQGNLNISEDSAKAALPYAAAGAVGIGALLLNEPLGKMGKGLFNGVKWVVTGGGYLEDIPLVGKVFSGLGWVADKLGDVSGYILGGATALLTFKLFENRGREPVETASTGTGAVGTPPETTTLQAGSTLETAPVRTAPNPPLPATLLPANPATAAPPNPTDYAALYAQRAEALQRGDREMSEALKPWLQYNNQVFENRIMFAKSAWLFNGIEGLTLTPQEETDLRSVETATSINRGARGRLVTALRGMGLTETEASSMIPLAPQLPMHSAGNIDFPGDLRDFATRFQATYGNDLIKVTEGGTTVAKNFADMSVTQKGEFLDAALTYARQRYRTIWNENTGNGTTWGGRANPVTPIEGEYPSAQWREARNPYIDFSVTDNHRITGQKTYRHANNRTINLKDEFKDFLAPINGDTGHCWTNIPDPQDEGNDVAIVEPYNGYLAESRLGGGLQRLRELFNRDVQPAVNRHREELASAHSRNTGIIEPYARQILASKARLNILREHHIALVDSLQPQAEGSTALQQVTAVDLRNPSLGANAPRMRWKGTFANGVFTVTEISLSPSSGFIRLDSAVPIDMNNPASGMRQILQKADDARARGLTARAPSGEERPALAFADVSVNEATTSAPRATGTTQPVQDALRRPAGAAPLV